MRSRAARKASSTDAAALDIQNRADKEHAMRYLTAAEAREFAAKWLPAWTGNDPALLAETENARRAAGSGSGQ